MSATLIVAGGWLVVELLRRNGRLLARVEQLEATLSRAAIEIPAPPVTARARADRSLRAGQHAPDFTLPDLEGRSTSLSDLLRPGHSLVLVFASPSCAPCRVLLERLAQWRARHGTFADPAPTVVIVGDDDVVGWRALPAELRWPTLLIQDAGEIADRYGIQLTPAAVVVSPDGLVTGPPALGGDAVRKLIVASSGESGRGGGPRHDARPGFEAPLAINGRAS